MTFNMEFYAKTTMEELSKKYLAEVPKEIFKIQTKSLWKIYGKNREEISKGIHRGICFGKFPESVFEEIPGEVSE